MQISGVKILFLVPKHLGIEWPRWRWGGLCAQFSLEEGHRRVAYAQHRKLLRFLSPSHPMAVGSRTHLDEEWLTFK